LLLAEALATKHVEVSAPPDLVGTVFDDATSLADDAEDRCEAVRHPPS
jgi:hypothetical protein